MMIFIDSDNVGDSNRPDDGDDYHIKSTDCDVIVFMVLMLRWLWLTMVIVICSGSWGEYLGPRRMRMGSGEGSTMRNLIVFTDHLILSGCLRLKDWYGHDM